VKLDAPHPSDFDPYYRRLGISKGQRPPAHYRLLGISPKEDDPEIIEAAIERQTNAVKGHKGTKHDALATQLLYEIQEAGVVILDPHRRKEYDAALARPKPRAKRSSAAVGVPPYSPYKPAGEQNEIVRTYFVVMSVIEVQSGLGRGDRNDGR
jgi:curved DNA-binding protein CbpA